MQNAVSTVEQASNPPSSAPSGVRTQTPATPTVLKPVAAISAALLLVLSFPDFGLWPMAWIALVPLLIAVANTPSILHAFSLGWVTGALFFLASCHWLTYSMINYGGVPAWLAYVLLIPGALILGLFPAGFAGIMARAVRSWGARALLAAPFVWTTMEWGRLELTGQLWNALGYSQAFMPALIQPARLGGIYAISFLVVTVNAAVALTILKKTWSAMAVSLAIAAAVVVVIVAFHMTPLAARNPDSPPTLHVVALQPNVPMDLYKSTEQIQELTRRHIEMSESALSQLPDDGVPRLVIWPESPMNFAYGADAAFRDLVGRFAQQHHTLVLFNSQEPAPNSGMYNSAVLVNEQGSLVGQYDKIRLLPFGEYVPLPRWLPGANLISAIVGDFTPGTNYSLLPAGVERAGVFICIEAAYPFIARRFTDEGATVLINISNDGYLGRTAVMRQHLSNAVFRAVENSRPVMRVTNTGITAYISPTGEISDMTAPFEPGVRSWTLRGGADSKSFYATHGAIFAGITFLITTLVLAATFVRRRT